jgi:hypothetical protein
MLLDNTVTFYFASLSSSHYQDNRAFPGNPLAKDDLSPSRFGFKLLIINNEYIYTFCTISLKGKWSIRDFCTYTGQHSRKTLI